MTLNGHCALCCTNHASFGAHHENLKNKINAHYHRQKNVVQGLYFQVVSLCGYSWGSDFTVSSPRTHFKHIIIVIIIIIINLFG